MKLVDTYGPTPTLIIGGVLLIALGMIWLTIYAVRADDAAEKRCNARGGSWVVTGHTILPVGKTIVVTSDHTCKAAQ